MQKKINSNGQASENLEWVNEYFNKLQIIIQEGGILPDDTYNMDETGFRIRMGKDQLIVTRLATVRSGPDRGLFWRLLKRPDCTVQSFVRLDWTVPKDRTVRRQ
jgi:hypothetical protein